MLTSVDFCRLLATFADYRRLLSISGRVLPTVFYFCRLPSTCADRESFHALHRHGRVLYVQQHKKACQCKKTTANAWTNWPALCPREKLRSFDLFSRGSRRR